MTKRKLGTAVADLAEVTQAWQAAADLLKVRRIQAAAIVERIIENLQIGIYIEDSDTGLWNLIDSRDEVAEKLSELGTSDYANLYYNDDLPAQQLPDPVIRILSRDLQLIVGHVKSIAVESSNGDSNVSSAERGDSRPDSELDRLKAEAASIVSDAIDRAPWGFARLVCERVLGIGQEGPGQPLTRDSSSKSDSRLRIDTSRWHDLAAAILQNLPENLPAGERKTKRLLALRAASVNGFILAKDWIATNYYPECVSSLWFTQRELADLIHNPSPYFWKMESSFGSSIGWFCQLVYHGIPLYLRQSDGSFPQNPISYLHEDYIYIAKKGEHWDIKDEGKYPYWAREYAVKLEHLKTHANFFSESESETPGPPVVAARRHAFRNAIGLRVEPGAAVSANDETIRSSGNGKSRHVREGDLTRRLRSHQQILLALACRLGWDPQGKKQIVTGDSPSSFAALVAEYFPEAAVKDDTIRATLIKAYEDMEDAFRPQKMKGRTEATRIRPVTKPT